MDSQYRFAIYLIEAFHFKTTAPRGNHYKTLPLIQRLKVFFIYTFGWYQAIVT